MPKMLTVDEQFDAIVEDGYRDLRGDKMDPYREPAPEPKPAEEKESKDKGKESQGEK